MKSRYSLPEMPKDKAPDHLSLFKQMLERYQRDMQELRMRTLDSSGK